MWKGLMKGIIYSASLVLCLLLATHPVLAADAPPVQGKPLPSFELAAPQDKEAKAYLGLADAAKFSVPQINARVVIIEIFNMY